VLLFSDLFCVSISVRLLSSAEDTWQASYQLFNNERNKNRTVFINYTVTYVPPEGQGGRKLIATTPLFFDVVPDCRLISPNPVTTNTGPIYTKSGAFESIFEGKIVFAAGHLHVGGLELALFDNGKVVCETFAQQSSGVYISRMSACELSAADVNIGDKLQIVAVYNSSQKDDHTIGVFYVHAVVKNIKDSDGSHILPIQIQANQVVMYWPLVVVVVAVVAVVFVLVLMLLVIFIIMLGRLRKENRLFKPRINEAELSLMEDEEHL